MQVEPYRLILDTGPLWELVLYRAVSVFRYRRLSGELSFLRTPNSYNNLSDYIASFRNKVTAPHVVAEISHKILRTDKLGQKSLWAIVYDEFQGMDEDLVRLIEMQRSAVERLGSVDASLLKLSSTYSAGTSLILSIDSSLIAECKRSGLLVRHLLEVI
jgi:N-acyl-D-aspartate/D-glutamate deacylase